MTTTALEAHTPRIDGRCATCGIGGSVCVSLLAALCSFGALGRGCTLSFYWVLPLSNFAFALCVLLCALGRRLVERGAPSVAKVGEGVAPARTGTRRQVDAVELLQGTVQRSSNKRADH